MRTLLLVCLVRLSLFGQSAERPPKAVEQPRIEKDQIPSDEKEGQQSPEGSSPSKAQLDASQHHDKPPTENQKSESEIKPEWWMISLTAGLVLVGAGQVLVLMRQTDILNRALTETRTATELTRQSLVLTQRPRIAVRTLILDEPRNYGNGFISTIRRDEPISNPDVQIGGTLLVVNTGNSQAVIRNTYCRIAKSEHTERLPRTFLDREEDVGVSLLPGGTRLAPGERSRCRFTGVGPSVLSVSRMGAVEPSILRLYVVGWIDYADELEYVRRTTFCRWYDRRADRFLPVTDADFEMEE